MMDDSFALKLCDDDFWSGEYVRRGAKALIPKDVAKSCRKQKDLCCYLQGALFTDLNAYEQHDKDEYNALAAERLLDIRF
jgi:hypothetical protein